MQGLVYCTDAVTWVQKVGQCQLGMGVRAGKAIIIVCYVCSKLVTLKCVRQCKGALVLSPAGPVRKPDPSSLGFRKELRQQVEYHRDIKLMPLSIYCVVTVMMQLHYVMLHSSDNQN